MESWTMSTIAWVSTAIRTPCSAARSFTPSSDGTWMDSTQPDAPPTRPSQRATEWSGVVRRASAST